MTENSLFDFGEDILSPKIEIKINPEPICSEIKNEKIKTVSVLSKIYEVNIE